MVYPPRNKSISRQTGKEKSSPENCVGKEYVSSQEGTDERYLISMGFGSCVHGAGGKKTQDTL